MGQILDGKKISAIVLADVKKRAEKLAAKGIHPGLATVLVGDDPASHVYVGQKIKKSGENGIASIHRPLPKNVSEADVIKTVEELNKSPEVHAILVQLPLPMHIDSEKVVNTIDPRKDADGLHPFNQGIMGRLKSWKDIVASGIPLPCTPAGVIRLLLEEKIEVSGKRAVVVGRSSLVGKPVAQLLLSLNATVTIAHSQTPDLPAVCREADILVAALGKPNFIGKDSVKTNAVVIDVGISRTAAGLKGDVDFEAVKPMVSWITPVPGGVGPMTVAMLLHNTVSLAEHSA
jgi:methylenetetrahydrofolate dehydrogenase (NADP+)/methenyltetrahydrofolate cyclohydrolase